MSCACNTSLPDAVRTSALQKLSKESREPTFLAAIAVPSFLQEVLLCVEGCASELVESSSSTNTDAPATMHSVQLCAHSLFLLGSLCCRSHGVLVSSRICNVLCPVSDVATQVGWILTFGDRAGLVSWTEATSHLPATSCVSPSDDGSAGHGYVLSACGFLACDALDDQGYWH